MNAIVQNMGSNLQTIPLKEIHPHPRNPRLAPREDVVEQIAAQITASGAFDPAHALIVRKNAAGFEIVSGHHRKLAADKAGLREVPCWVREMSDDDAYMALVLNNAQGELGALEIGMHALGFIKGGGTQRYYADRIGMHEDTLAPRVKAARVTAGIDRDIADCDCWQQLSAIHVAAEWAWPALVEAMLEEGWTVEKTRKQAARFKEVKRGDVPHWIDLHAVAVEIIAGGKNPIPSIIAAFDNAMKTIGNAHIAEVPVLFDALQDGLQNNPVAKLSDALAIINPVLEELQSILAAIRDRELAEQREKEARHARLVRLRNYVSLEEWKTLNPEEQRDLLAFGAANGPSFNPQENADIEWAQWSWNPITGCLHDCPYCYARDIALQKRMEKVYPNGFAPTLRPMHLLAPMAQKPPKEAATDARYRNVFTGSMADMFGRWVPEEWIEAVLSQMRANPQWNFLCLTKFPKRMAEFDIPSNTWMGTTVDLQARIPAAEAAFAKVNAAVKWLSIEPMLEPLKFSRLDLFDWIVVGGASRSTKTPEWHPPSAWVHDLKRQAEVAGVAWYEKKNLWSTNTARTLQLPAGLPIMPDEGSEPELVFRYLGKAKTADQKAEA